eukprot:1924597-Rhodomonas_salina.1
MGPTHVPDGPELVEGEEEFVVEEILAYRGSGRRTQYLVRWAMYGPEDDLWLPKRNLANAQEILDAYLAQQEEKSSPNTWTTRRQCEPPSRLTR